MLHMLIITLNNIISVNLACSTDMAATAHSHILLLTLVHPDFLPPVYATARVLRDTGYAVSVLTFDSYVPAETDLGDDIVIESVGKHHGIGARARIKLRRKYAGRAKELASRHPSAIIAFCPFSFLCGLRIKKDIPLIYSALEVADFMWPVFMRSPLSNLNNLRALRNVHKADLVTTPSAQRSAWLAGRCHLKDMPLTVLNTAYLPPMQDAGGYEIYEAIVPGHFLQKKVILYTGAVNDQLCVKELVQAFDQVDDGNSALVITGIKDNAYCNTIKQIVSASRTADRILRLPYVTRPEMLALQANAQIGACLAKEYSNSVNNVESKMMAPNKVGEYLAKGLYLLGVRSEYMMPFELKGIAALAEIATVDNIATAMRNALKAVEQDGYRHIITDFVKDYYCMQQQLKPVIKFLEEHNNEIK
jgi:hypothetical protein